MTLDDLTRADSGGRRGVSRRALFAGVGTSAALLTTAALTHAADADSSTHPLGAPSTDSIGSPPISGYDYHSVCMFDFLPYSPSSMKTFGGYGIYSAGVQSAMWASIDIPSGALVRDVEWYMHNSSTEAVFPDLYQYTPGNPQLTAFDLTASIPANSTGVVAARAIVPTNVQGPFPLGSRLLAGITTPVDGSVQINGARVGFTRGGGSVGLLSKPKRVFDNRKGKKLQPGPSHTITLPASLVSPGVSAVLVNVTAVDGAPGGALKVYPGDASAPADASLDFGTATIANAVTVRISSSRQLQILVTKSVFIVIDLVGTIS